MKKIFAFALLLFALLLVNSQVSAYHRPGGVDSIQIVNITTFPVTLNISRAAAVGGDFYGEIAAVRFSTNASRLAFMFNDTGNFTYPSVAYVVVRNVTGNIPPGSVLYFYNGWHLAYSGQYVLSLGTVYVFSRPVIQLRSFTFGDVPLILYTTIEVELPQSVRSYPSEFNVFLRDRSLSGFVGEWKMHWTSADGLPFGFGLTPLEGVYYRTLPAGAFNRVYPFPPFVSPSESSLIKAYNRQVIVQYAFDLAAR